MATKEIPLTRGLVAIVDEQDYELLSTTLWHATRGSSLRTFYAAAYIDSKYVRMHRLIIPVRDGFVVDHVDGNGLNNTRKNLRVATLSQNMFNRSAATKARSRFKGVTHHKNGGGWQAEIRANRRKYYLGFFKNELDAARAYDAAARELHGEFARVNGV